MFCDIHACKRLAGTRLRSGADKKVGVVISPDQASSGNFVAAINRVLGDSTVRNNVQRVQEAIRSADGLSIAAGILETAFELEESQQGVA